jgi:hypothetical protein
MKLPRRTDDRLSSSVQPTPGGPTRGQTTQIDRLSYQLARALLRLCCPARDRVYVLGDLDAEYELRGRPTAWYWRQAIRSAGALIVMGSRRGDWEYALFAVMFATAAPAVLMEALWSFILSSVPLKVGDVRGVDFAVTSLTITALLCFGAGIICTVRGLLWAIPTAWLFALLAQAAVHNIAPTWFGAATLAAVTAAITLGAWLRRLLDGGQLS